MQPTHWDLWTEELAEEHYRHCLSRRLGSPVSVRRPARYPAQACLESTRLALAQGGRLNWDCARCLAETDAFDLCRTSAARGRDNRT